AGAARRVELARERDGRRRADNVPVTAAACGFRTATTATRPRSTNGSRAPGLRTNSTDSPTAGKKPDTGCRHLIPRWRRAVRRRKWEPTMRSRPEVAVSVEGMRETVSRRAEALASVLERGAAALAEFAEGLNDSEWQTPVPHDGRKIGVVVHHVASMYPLEVGLAQKLAAGGVVDNVTWDQVHAINAQHARDHAAVRKAEALALLRQNSAAAAAAIRAIGDADLDRVAPNSMYGSAPLTCQFMLEDHAVRHSFHHLAKIR